MKLNHKIYGEGPDIIILHGLLGMLDNWKTFARNLENDYKVHLLDLRNHGKSPHDDQLDYHVMAEDVKTYIEDFAIQNPIIVGHSMGGKVAMNLALNDPALVDKLVVVDISPKAYPAGHHKIFEVLLGLQLDLYEKRKEVYDVIFDKLQDEGLSLFLMKNLSRSPEGGYAWKMNLEGIYRNYDHILQAIESPNSFMKPSIFIRGAKSAYIQGEDEALIKTYFPLASIQTIEDAGHWVHAEKPNELKSAFIDFITK